MYENNTKDIILAKQGDKEKFNELVENNKGLVYNIVKRFVGRGYEIDDLYDETGYLCGETGCGMCALYQLREAGITHLKLVGRGNYTDFMEKDIRNLRTALNILEATDTQQEFIQQMKNTLFPDGCSRNCYY